MRHPTDVDRLNARHRPSGQPVMHQDWGKLLFMHWRINENLLRPHVPKSLEIDTYGNSAWIAITPFTMWDIRAFPPYVPPVPGLDSMEELNVRTYVHYKGVPGVWFFSLDANSRAAVLGARAFFYLPYYHADIRIDGKNKIKYRLKRRDDPPAAFKADWTVGKALPKSQPGSREFFLTERYMLYTESEGELYRSRIYHEPWQLYQAELTDFASSMLEAKQITQPTTQPLLHHAEEVSVDIWPLEPVE
ncbi:MAG TPA: DUF2071 domain-containing protein [Pyrinomonadaceae bacterium]|nr:DUF2071 domain-containing protein [Pyrinomonadaceae bacterium]